MVISNPTLSFNDAFAASGHLSLSFSLELAIIDRMGERASLPINVGVPPNEGRLRNPTY